MQSGQRLSFAVVHAESDFRAEFGAGDTIYLETAIEEIGTKSLTFRHRLYRAADRALTFETLFKCVMLSLESRRAEVIPEAVQH